MTGQGDERARRNRPKPSNQGSSADSRWKLELHRIHHVASIVAEEAPSPRIVVRVAGIAVVRDGLVRAGGVFVGNDVSVEQPHAHGATGADAISPAETQVRLVSGGLEPSARGHRHMTELRPAAVSDFAILDMIARTTVAIHASAEFFPPGASLHRASADLAIADFADA